MTTTELTLESIRVSDFNARKDLDAGSEDAGIEDLAKSIREHGVLNPVIVRSAVDGTYDLIAGQRRLLACRELGLRTIPATIRDDLSDTDSTVVSLVENVQRADMNPIDKARAYDAIRTKSGSVRDVAKATGVTEPTVRKYLALLKLAPSIQNEVTTSNGPAGIGMLSKLAEAFPPKDQVKARRHLNGLSQSSQLEMLRASNGDLGALPRLREQILERDLHLRMCREGLCSRMPTEWKARVNELLSGTGAAQPVELQLPPLNESTPTVN